MTDIVESGKESLCVCVTGVIKDVHTLQPRGRKSPITSLIDKHKGQAKKTKMFVS